MPDPADTVPNKTYKISGLIKLTKDSQKLSLYIISQVVINSV